MALVKTFLIFFFFKPRVFRHRGWGWLPFVSTHLNATGKDHSFVSNGMHVFISRGHSVIGN